MTSGRDNRAGASARKASRWPALLGVLAIPAIVLAQTTANGTDPAHNCKACIGPPDAQVCSYANCGDGQACTGRRGTFEDGTPWVLAVCRYLPAVP